MKLRCEAAVLAVCGCVALALIGGFALPAAAQAPAGAPAAAADDDEHFTADELRQLVAPIALYPDPLIGIILPASTFPLDVVQAARFIDRRARDPNAQPSDSWNESVRALINYPEVVKQLNDDLDWTNDLGLAVANQQSDVLDAIQRYRRMAVSAGNLRTDERQTVQQTAETVAIQPTNPERVYVPQYDPEVVVVQQQAAAPAPMAYYPAPYPNYAYPYPAGYAFTGFATGMVVGGLTAAWAMNWGNNSIENVNINRQANIQGGSRTTQIQGGTIQGGTRWQAQRPASGNNQLRPAQRGQSVQRPAGTGNRDPGQLGQRQRPGDPQFGGRDRQQQRPQQGNRPQQVGAAGDRRAPDVARPNQGARPGQGGAGERARPAQGGQRQQAARPAQQGPSRDAFAAQGSRNAAQRDAARGQASRGGGGAAAARGGGAPRGGGGGGARGGGGGGGGGRGGGGRR